ncbi:hypothetical protein FRC03_009595 [Tulasnella sp. 419]|nr:hypothetical protein FRC02_010715 [Tulasnella sp. 418]KAG8970322.1 hypothetical protein FRC03_009595 [Tulasnella sp. 419]
MDPNAYQPHNPDQRPLPWGFVQRFDQQYKTWYYVNTQTNPPQSSWTHPADQQQQGYPQQQAYPQQGYPQHGDYHGGHPQQHYAEGGHHKSGGGMGTGAALAIGAGAGVVGGLVIADQIQDMQEEAYQEGFEAGAGGGDESD